MDHLTTNAYILKTNIMLILKYYARKYNPLCIMSSFHCVKVSGKENVNNAKKGKKITLKAMS